MSATEFADFLDMAVFVFGPWLPWFIVFGIAGSLFVSIGIMFATGIARWTRR